jgi:hypothetical protein
VLRLERRLRGGDDLRLVGEAPDPR